MRTPTHQMHGWRNHDHCTARGCAQHTSLYLQHGIRWATGQAYDSGASRCQTCCTCNLVQQGACSPSATMWRKEAASTQLPSPSSVTRRLNRGACPCHKWSPCAQHRGDFCFLFHLISMPKADSPDSIPTCTSENNGLLARNMPAAAPPH